MKKACPLVLALFWFVSYHSWADAPRNHATAATLALLSSPVPYRGVNLNGAEFGSGNLPGTFGIDFTYPDPTYVSGYTSVDYFLGKGMNTFRLPFRWERLQRTLGQAFDATELGRLRTTVTHLTGKGAYVLLDPHNFARY